jgi:acetoin utilization protein AcuB
MTVNTHFTVRECMTAAPETIRPGLPLAEAHRLMRERNIRHLPVLEGGKLVGVVSQRDLYLIESLKGVDPEKVPVEEAMSPQVWAVDPETPVVEAARYMHSHKDGCAVVVDHEKVIGVFTTTDGMRVLAEVLSQPKKSRRS